MKDFLVSTMISGGQWTLTSAPVVSPAIFTMYPMSKFTMDAKVIYGSAAALQVILQGNQGSNLSSDFDSAGLATYNYTSSELSMGYGSFSVTNQPCRNVRAIINNFSGASGTQITLTLTGAE